MRCNVDRNKKDRSFDQQYKSIEQLIREAYGLSPDQMEKRMEWAEAEAASDAPLGGRSIPNAPEHEFQTILSKMEARGITPRVMADFSRDQQRALQSENGFLAAQRAWLSVKPDPVIKSKGLGPGRRESENAKKTFFSVPVRTAGAAAACVAAGIAIFTLRPGIDVMGKRNYTYVSEVRDGEKTDIVWNNQENYISDGGKLEEAYAEINETLGIKVLKVNYLPADVELEKVSINSGQARLTFSYEQNYIYVLEVLYAKNNSDGRFSDGHVYKNIFNEWLNRDISIQRTEQESGQYEYSAYLEIDNAHYYIHGAMEEDEFVNIIENVSF